MYFQSFEYYQVKCFLSCFRFYLFGCSYYLLVGSSWMVVGITGSMVGSAWDHGIDVGLSTAVSVSSDGCWIVYGNLLRWSMLMGKGSRQLMACCSNRNLLMNDGFNMRCKCKFCMEDFG